MFSSKTPLILRNISSIIFKSPQNPHLYQSSVNPNHKFFCHSGGDTKDVTYEEVKNMKDNKTVYLIDVREPEELKETGSIPGSINIPLNELETTLKNLSSQDFIGKYRRDKPNFDTPLVFSCKAGVRSQKALNIAQSLGFKRLRNYRGGWLDWEKNIKQS
ncbi:rhodanese domain-containing protein CG4456-like [Onthophagus taurus]|uniref:rhodanese domain-containing protein CG4456-like n=1 Tax=Onthophagus taurus TaxID=166361 RepID=UPI0039BDC841